MGVQYHPEYKSRPGTSGSWNMIWMIYCRIYAFDNHLILYLENKGMSEVLQPTRRKKRCALRPSPAFYGLVAAASNPKQARKQRWPYRPSERGSLGFSLIFLNLTEWFLESRMYSEVDQVDEMLLKCRPHLSLAETLMLENCNVCNFVLLCFLFWQYQLRNSQGSLSHSL